MLNVAMKEWAVICDLLLEGELALLLRKGGIHERSGPGVFELEHPQFALFPSWTHQRPEAMKPAYQDRVVVLDEPRELTVGGSAEAARIWRVPSRAAFDRLDDLHCWSAAQIDMRFDYRPENPIYLLALRCGRLAEPRTILNRGEYAGCVSWVPLEPDDAVDDAGGEAVLAEAELARVISRVDEVFSG
ncbi:MAG: hypothetical protein CMJ49_12520 [Planctomycetaceae bacterium]|nr:hypothetical protein [Planctomycetaceae bacterium]